MQKLNEIITKVKQPEFTDEMIKLLVDGLNHTKGILQVKSDFYGYVQEQNALENNNTEINRNQEQELFIKMQKGYNQKGQFQHMGSTSDIDYVFSRLYINCSKQDLMQIANLFVDACQEKRIPIYFKYCSDESNRADQLIIYSNLGNLEQYIHILRSIAQENPEMVKRCGKPPILTGTLDEWIGIGDEPKEKGTSYSKTRADAIEAALRKTLPEEDVEKGYNWNEIDFDKIRQAIDTELKAKGISIDNFSFNQENLFIYNMEEQSREKLDETIKNQILRNKQEILSRQKQEESYQDERNAYLKLRILQNLGEKSPGLQEGVSALNARYGFLSDIMCQSRINIDSVLGKKYNVPIGTVLKEGFVLKKRIGTGEEQELSDEQNAELNSKILEDTTKFYTEYFANETGVLEETLERYKQISKIPKGQSEETEIERADLYSKLKFLQTGSGFFKQIGISEENIEMVSSIITDCFKQLEEAEIKEWDNSIDKALEEVTLSEHNNATARIKESEQERSDLYLEDEQQN